MEGRVPLSARNHEPRMGLRLASGQRPILPASQAENKGPTDRILHDLGGGGLCGWLAFGKVGKYADIGTLHGAQSRRGSSRLLLDLLSNRSVLVGSSRVQSLTELAELPRWYLAQLTRPP